MIPGIAAGVIAAVYFAGGGSTFITIVLFCILITFMMNTINEMRLMRRDMDILNQKILYVAEATDDQITTLADNVNDDIHEVVMLIANNRDQEEDN